MDIKEIILRRTIPVIINSFNQLFYLENLIEKFLQEKFSNIIIIDNGSTYEPLNTYLKNISITRKEILVLYYNQNNGPRHFHNSGLYKMLGNIPHLYTDPDLDFEELAPDFLTKLIDFSKKYKKAKVGCALEIPTQELINNNLHYRHIDGNIYTINEVEEKYWIDPVEEDVFKAPVDTTLHLFNPEFIHLNTSFIDAIRVARDGFILRHRPWYKSDQTPEPEQSYYRNLSENFNSWRPKDSI